MGGSKPSGDDREFRTWAVNRLITLLALVALVIASFVLMPAGPGGTGGVRVPTRPQTERNEQVPLESTGRLPERVIAVADESRTHWEFAGRVTDGRDIGIVGANVVLLYGPDLDPEQANELASATCDPDGSFTTVVPESAAQAFVLASAKGYVSAVAPAERGSTVHMRLRRRTGVVIVRGKVLDEQRRILQTFQYVEQVRVEDAHVNGLRSAWRPVFQDSQGFELELAPLPSGEVDLHLRAAGFRDHQALLSTADSSTLELGEIVLVRGDLVWGVVVDGIENPIGRASIQPTMSGGAPPQRILSEASDGTFEFIVPPGAEVHSIYAIAAGHAPRWIHARDVAGVWQDLRVVLGPGARVTGQVRRDGQPLEGAEVCAWLAAPGDAELVAGAFGTTPWVRQARTNAEGIYLIEQVPGGQLRIGARRNPLLPTLSRIMALESDSASLFAVDFDLDGATQLEGRLNLLPDLPAEDSLILELREATTEGTGRALASTTVDGGRYRFEHVPDELVGKNALLRVYVAPRNFIERPLHVSPGVTNLGTLDLSRPEALLEFNRPGSEFFSFGSVGGK